MIPDAVLDEIRGRVDIVAVIGRHMELKRSGRTWKGCCVFHGERTPSFHVYPEDRHWKCYGCGEYGDVFKFLQKLQGKEFPEVVRALAQEVGVAIPEREEDSAEHRRRRQERAELLAALEAAARYFAARLESRYGADARAYLDGRGLTSDTVKQFRLGVASTAWDDLTGRLAPKGVTQDALEKSGLVARSSRDERRYDRFRARLMIPIVAADGEVIGFGGRVLPGAPENQAKYINSPETPLYKKSLVLYGLDQAREAIRRTRSAVLVEGYFDVIGLHQAGVKNAVAVCGTALTPEHVEVLRRLDCRTVTLFFDGDAAGVAAASKAAPALLPSGLLGRVAVLPRQAGKIDPDEFARAQGLEAVNALLAEAPTLTDYLIDRAIAEHYGPSPKDASYERRVRAYQQLRPLLDAVPKGSLSRKTFEEHVARKLDLNLDSLRDDLGSETSLPAVPGPRAAAVAVKVPEVVEGRALDALGLLAAFPQLAEVAQEERLVELFTGLPLEAVTRELIAGTLEGEALLGRLEPFLPEGPRASIARLLAEARPEPERAEREFRKAMVAAKIDELSREIDRLSAEAARGPLSHELQVEMLTAIRRRSDLEKRRDGRRPG